MIARFETWENITLNELKELSKEFEIEIDGDNKIVRMEKPVERYRIR